jgi:hypothetical protein
MKITGYRREDRAGEAGGSEEGCRAGACENRTEDGERYQLRKKSS